MSLKYALLEAHLTPAPDDYVVQVQDVQSHGMDSITEKMVQKGSTVTKTDVSSRRHHQGRRDAEP